MVRSLLESIQQAYGTDTVHVRLDGNSSALGNLPGVAGVVDYGHWQELRIDPGSDTNQLLAALMARGTVRHFEISHPSLHDIFVRIATPADSSLPLGGEGQGEGEMEETEESHHA